MQMTLTSAKLLLEAPASAKHRNSDLVKFVEELQTIISSLEADPAQELELTLEIYDENYEEDPGEPEAD